MKRFAILSAVALLATPAVHAQTTGTLTFNLNATVPTVCGISRDGASAVSLNFNTLAQIPAGQRLSDASSTMTEVTYRCNAPNGFTRTVTSTNGGKLVRQGTSGGEGNEIPYNASQTGQDWGTLSSPRTESFAGSRTLLAGERVNIQFEPFGVQGNAAGGVSGTTVFAGNYSDTVTVTVVAN